MKQSRSSSAQALLRIAVAISAALTTWSASAAVVENFPIKVSTSLDTPDPTFTTPATAFERPLTPFNSPPGTFGTGYYPSPNEYGVVATIDPLNPGGNVLRGVEIPYFSNYGLASGLSYKIYANDGPLIGGKPSPGTLLDSRSENITVIGAGSVTFLAVNYNYAGANQLPTPPASFTVTLQFGQFGVGGRAGGWLISDSGVTTGTGQNYFWENVGGNWQAKTFGPVPEPNSTVIAGAVLGVAALVFRARRNSR